MNTNIEQQARTMLALGLDEYGHHNEAENVRRGEDLDSYRVALFALNIALTQATNNTEVLTDAQIEAALDTKLGLDHTLRQLVHGDTVSVGHSKVHVVRALLKALAPNAWVAVSDEDIAKIDHWLLWREKNRMTADIDRAIYRLVKAAKGEW